MAGARCSGCRGWLLAAVLGCAGCTAPAPVPTTTTEFPRQDTTALDSRATVPVIERAVQQDHLLTLDYRAQDAVWRATVSVGPLPDSPFLPAGKRRPVRQLEPLPDAGLTPPVAGGDALPVHGPAAWHELLNAALDTLTPVARGAGASVDILKEDELFLYRGTDGELVAVPMLYKPAGIEVRRTWTFAELLAVLRQRLADRHGPAARLVFETGDDRAWGYPFVYIDLATDLVLFLQDAPAAPASAPGAAAGGTLRLLLHTALDHVRGVVSQPVSSAVRLFTLAGGVTADLAHPAPLAMLAERPLPPAGQAAGMDLVRWEARLDELTATTASAGRLDYLVDGATFFPRLIDRIGTARESVWLRVYIFDNDDYATGIADLLRRRARDVDVRVLVDGIGTLGAGMASSPSLPRGHVPEPSITRYLRRDTPLRVRSVPNVWLTGDHTKTIVIDGETAFLGGMNIGREYRYDWHDLMVEVSGPVVGDIEAGFLRAWDDAGWFGDLRRFFARERPAAPAAGPDDYPLRLLYTRPTDAQILRAQIAATRQARQRIYLENPYLTSDEMIYELVKARRRGVDVRVILPYRTDSGLISRSNALAANTMLRHGIRVYIYPGMSHLKAAVYDGWACLGSANLDRLSLRTNREMNLATSHAPAVEGLVQAVFTADMERAVELDEPLPADWSHYLAELLADYL